MIQGWFRPFSAAGWYDLILAESARFGMNQPESVRIEAKLARIWKKKKKKKKDAAPTRAGSSVGCLTLRRATSDSSAAPSQPRWCFLD